MNEQKEKLVNELEVKNQQVNDIYDALGDEEPTTEQKQTLDRLEKEMQETEGKLQPILDREQKRDGAKERQTRIEKMRLPQGKSASAEELTDAVAQAGFGKKFTQSPQYKQWLKGVAPQGHIQANVSLASPTVAIPGLEKSLQMARAKAAGAVVTASSPTSAGALITEQRLPLVNEGLIRILTLRDLFTVVPTTSNTIEYPQVTSFTNNASPMPETNVAKFTGANGQISGESPMSGLGLRVVTDRVRRIGHHFVVTTLALLDGDQLAALIDTFLLYGMKEKGETMTVSGDGNGENYRGILNTDGIEEQPFDGDILKTLRKMRTRVSQKGRVKPTAYALSAIDCEKLDLLTDGNQRYYFGGPSEIGNRRVWGLPVVETESLDENKGICAAWQYAALYDRGQGSINATNAPHDYSLRGLVAIVGEVLEGFGVHHPAAFCVGELEAPEVGGGG